MTEFKLVISDPKAKKAYQIELKDADAERLLGLKVGNIIRGETINLAGYEFKITGGSDKQGFPMRPDVSGTKRIRALIGSGVGIRNAKHGLKKRKSIRGNQISEDISQINLKLIKEGSKPLGVVLGKEEEKGGEKTKGEPKSEESKPKKEEVAKGTGSEEGKE